MIYSQLEYLALLTIATGAIYSLFPEIINNLVKRRAFWISFLAFFAFCCAVDYAGIKLGWWHFSAERILGITILDIPVEEFILFFVGFLTTVTTWEFMNSET